MIYKIYIYLPLPKKTKEKEKFCQKDEIWLDLKKKVVARINLKEPFDAPEEANSRDRG